MANPFRPMFAGGCALIGLVVLIVPAALLMFFIMSLAEKPQDGMHPMADTASVHCTPDGDNANTLLNQDDEGEAPEEISATGIQRVTETDDADADDAPEAEIPDEYNEDVAAAAEAAQVPESMVAALIYYESGWREDAVSHVGARGFGQFMPEYWEDEWGDIDDPNDSIHAVGQRLAELRDQMEPHADDEEHMWQLMLAGYNAGGPMVAEFDYDLDRMFNHGDPDNINSFASQTASYVENIVAASSGNSGAHCDVPQGDLTEVAMQLAHEEEVSFARNYAADAGREEARDEYVELALQIHPDHEPSNAFFTDCGAFVSTVVRHAGVDPDFPYRGTSPNQHPHVGTSDRWETFSPENEGQLKSGDVLVSDGHIYIYTGPRPDGNAEEGTNRALGASHYTRPPSGHHVWLEGGYTVARYVGSDGSISDDEPIEV